MSYVYGPLLRIPETIESAVVKLQSLARGTIADSSTTHPTADGKDGPQTDCREQLASWKFLGYPALSKWLVSAPGRLTLRRFAQLNARVLLQQQNEIVEREKELKRMDEWTMVTPGKSCGSLRNDTGVPRGDLLNEIGELLRDYNGRLSDFVRLQNQPSASEEQVRNLQLWLDAHPNVIEPEERAFAFEQEDLVDLGDLEDPLITAMAKIMSFDFKSAPGLRPTLRSLRSSALSLAGLAIPLVMLLAPAWAMAFACDCGERMAIVTSFTIIFCLGLLTSTNLGPSHRSIAAAGYFAILILVLGLIPMRQTARLLLPTRFNAPAANECEMFRIAVERMIYQYHQAAMISTLI